MDAGHALGKAAQPEGLREIATIIFDFAWDDLKGSLQIKRAKFHPAPEFGFN